MCYDALTTPMVYISSCLQRLYPPSYVALRVRSAVNLRFLAYRLALAAEQADRRVLRTNSENVMAQVMAVARRGIPARGGGGLSIRGTRDGRGERVTCSTIFHGLVKEMPFVRVSFS